MRWLPVGVARLREGSGLPCRPSSPLPDSPQLLANPIAILSTPSPSAPLWATLGISPRAGGAAPCEQGRRLLRATTPFQTLVGAAQKASASPIGPQPRQPAGGGRPQDAAPGGGGEGRCEPPAAAWREAAVHQRPCRLAVAPGIGSSSGGAWRRSGGRQRRCSRRCAARSSGSTCGPASGTALADDPGCRCAPGAGTSASRAAAAGGAAECVA